MNLFKSVMTKKNLFCIFISIYVIWAAFFIARSSFLAIDGKRYFSLFDDAMISMRYAWNFSHGNGLVWNPGEYVEGYTNFLMTLIMSAATLIFNERFSVLAIQIFGIFTVIGVVWQASKLYSAVTINEPNELLEILFPLLVLLYYPLSYWSLMGMETGLVTFLILSSFNLLLKYETENRFSTLALSAFFASLAYLTRPDAVLIIIPISIFILTRPTKITDRLIDLLRFGGVFALIPLAHLLFRYTYYGDILPNTYYLKLSGMTTAKRLEAGLNFTYPFLISTLLVWVFAALNSIFNFSRRKLLFLSTALIYIVYQIWIGGDAWNYWRMVTPVVPMGMILFIGEFYLFIGVALKTLLNSNIREYLNRNPVWNDQALTFNKFSRKTISRALMIIGLFCSLMILASGRLGLGEPGFGYAKLSLLLGAGLFITISWLIGASGENYDIKIHKRIFIFGLLGILFMADQKFIPQMLFTTTPYQEPSNRGNVNIAIAINEISAPQLKLGVFWAGSVPYYTHRYAVDFLGKSDPYIAHLSKIEKSTVNTLPGHNKFDLRYSILELKPDYVAGFEWGGIDISSEAKDLYERVKYKGVNLYLLKNSEQVKWDLLSAAGVE